MFFASPEAGHEKNASADTGVAQWNGLIQRGHAEPTRSLLLERQSTLDRAMPVGVGLHNRADGHGAANVLLHRAKVSSQRSQRYLGPSRPSRGALGNFDSSHLL